MKPSCCNFKGHDLGLSWTIKDRLTLIVTIIFTSSPHFVRVVVIGSLFYECFPDDSSPLHLFFQQPIKHKTATTHPKLKRLPCDC